MKRRNAEFGKIRRPVKRNKIAEGFYWLSNFLNAKYFFLWGLVVTADFMLDFRFELLWPFWLLLRSVYDSYKYKGLTFTILFVCIAITSDLVCLFFIPVNWLFFLASTYVWVQYVWHAAVDKGSCMPTIFLWTIFLYLEGAVRWRNDKTIPHIDLCRPFAAHCIGYPVVTLGFGIKSYIGYRIRNRKQREVAKENEFFIQVLQLALPNDNPTEDELIAQMQQAHEILHSDRFGDIDLPISSPIITQRIQQQRLLLANNLLNGIPEPVGSRDESSGSHKLISNHTMNGFPSQIAISSKASSLPIATVSASTGAAVNSVPAVTLNHSNNNIFSSSNLNLSTDGLNGNHNGNNQPINSQPQQNNHHNHQHHQQSTSQQQQQHLNTASIPTYRINRRSVNERSDNEANGSDLLSSSSVRHIFKLIVIKTKANSFGAGIKRCCQALMLMFIGKISTAKLAIRRRLIGTTSNDGSGSSSGSTRTTTSTNTNISTGTTPANGINSLNRTGNLHRSTETNGHLNTAIVAPMNAKADNESSNGQIVQTSYSNYQSRAKDTEKTFCDNQFNQLENNCNNGTEHIERSRGRRNRGKQKEAIVQNCKENHVIRNLSPVSQQSEHCESCSRLEGELKRFRNEINHLKHLEHELRHKNDQNTATKSCLQAKQKENDELEKRIQELVSVRHTDKQNLQQIERKLAEERRQKQSVESQLNNERNKRKQTEEKLARVDCSENCKLRKQILENECKQLRKELSVSDELKKSAEKQSRNYEQELRKFEAELRSREPRESTEVLMSALQAMQEKNKTLEKSLSAETRVKLDLFSALGEAKRQLEIRDNLIRQKDKDVADLKAKIAQLYAVMPNEQYLPSSPTPLQLRLGDTGPSSPLSHTHVTDTIYTQNNDVQ